MDYIDEVFSEGGHLATLFPSYKPRMGQIQIARAIDKAILEGGHVIAEGPTGTGKSLSYAVPASYRAVHDGKKVCIVTANKNLQRQIYLKDLGDLSLAVPWKFSYAIRKGVSSYVCQRNVDSGHWRDGLAGADDEDTLKIHEMNEWLDETDTGDFEESPGPSLPIWKLYSTGREDCDGRKCDALDECYSRKASERAKEAHLVVTNYHMFFLHIRSGGKILSPFDVVIFDEAHRAAGIARDFFGTEISVHQVSRCVTSLSTLPIHAQEGRVAREEVMRQANILWSDLKRGVIDRDEAGTELLEQALQRAAGLYHRTARAFSTKSGGTATDSEGARYAKMGEKCDKLVTDLASFRIQGHSGIVCSVEGGANGPGVLKSRMIDVGGILRTGLFDKTKTVIQTSATLAVRGGGKSNFEYLRRETGMNGLRNVNELVVESPFNWPEQALLVIPKTMPRYSHLSSEWDRAICEHFEKIVNAVGGRTMGLFTSFRVMELVRDHLRKTTKWTILAQRDTSNGELVKRFQEVNESVLLGTESFAEGISVEGDTCSCVVLDKIPFISQDDPIAVGLERMGRKPFNEYMLPEAIISFKQRLGRLIRTTTDTGVVVVLDDRILTKSYGRQFLSSIPPLKVSHSIDDIAPAIVSFRHKKGGTSQRNS